MNGIGRYLLHGNMVLLIVIEFGGVDLSGLVFCKGIIEKY